MYAGMYYASTYYGGTVDTGGSSTNTSPQTKPIALDNDPNTVYLSNEPKIVALG